MLTKMSNVAKQDSVLEGMNVRSINK
jgi:hypothetical protein